MTWWEPARSVEGGFDEGEPGGRTCLPDDRETMGVQQVSVLVVGALSCREQAEHDDVEELWPRRPLAFGHLDLDDQELRLLGGGSLDSVEDHGAVRIVPVVEDLHENHQVAARQRPFEEV